MDVKEMGRALLSLKDIFPQWAPKNIGEKTCLIWLKVLDGFSDQEIRNAFITAAGSLTSFPPPLIIKRICEGSNTDEENGQDIASRIEGSISKFGYCDPVSAKKYIGDLGWLVVEQLGGWINICEVEYNTLPSARKQWRDLAVLISKNLFFIGKNNPPKLPERRSGILQEAVRIATQGSDNRREVALETRECEVF